MPRHLPDRGMTKLLLATVLALSLAACQTTKSSSCHASKECPMKTGKCEMAKGKSHKH